MPGSVAVSAPADVMPNSLSTVFQQTHEYASAGNVYANGEWQSQALVTTPRRKWKMTKRLAAADLVTLRDYFDAHIGLPFWFYDPILSNFTYDATGVQTLGRFTVMFQGNFSQDSDKGRTNCSLELAEIF